VNTDNTAACDDGDACTENDTCSGGSCAGSPVNCDDGDSCTVDTCVGGVCDSALDCNLPGCSADPRCDLCSGADCDDGNVCTDDSCDPATGLCVNTDNTAPCDDGNACTSGDTCSGGSCNGTSISCDDGNICTDDSCDPVSGCVNTPNTDPCDDGQFCTVGDACMGGNCMGGSPRDCSDGVSCTDDSCNEMTDSCDNVANDANCSDDGLFCNGTEFCDPTADCSSTGDPCAAGEVCDESTDTCIAEPVDLDIKSFQVSKNVKVGDQIWSRKIQLTVKNPNGSNTIDPRTATLVGIQNGVEVYRWTRPVFDMSGNGSSRFAFPTGPLPPDFLPIETGVIDWTVTIDDDDPDVDTATATTTIK